MKRNAAATLILSAVIAASCAGSAFSQTQERKKVTSKSALTPDKQSRAGEPDVSKSVRRRKVLLDRIDIIGTLAKPQAIFIIPGSDPRVDGITIDRSFFREIFRPVEKDFFPQKGRRKFRGAIPW